MTLKYFFQMQKRPTTYNVVIRVESSDNNLLIVAVAAHSVGCEHGFLRKDFFLSRYSMFCSISSISFHAQLQEF